LISSGFIFLMVAMVSLHHPFMAIPFAVLAFFAKEDAIAAFPLLIALTALQDWRIALGVAGVCLFIGLRSHANLMRLTRQLFVNSGRTQMVNAGMAETLPLGRYIVTATLENLIRWPRWVAGFKQSSDPKWRCWW
jgi:hypothetical protein